MKARFTVFVVMLTELSVLAGSENPAMPSHIDLTSAVRMAYDHNPVINEAREKIKEQGGLLMSTESTALPSINGFGVYQWDESDRLGSFGGTGEPDEEYWRAGIALTQPLYSGGQLRAAISSRRLQTEALNAEVVAAQSKVMANVHKNFYAALLSREVLKVRQESLQLLENQLQLAQNRFNAGAGARFDVLQAEVRLANARPPLIKAGNDYRISIDQLRSSLGAVYGADSNPENIVIDGVLETTGGEIALPDALNEAMAKRPELIALSHRIEAAREDLKKSKAQRSPRFDLFSSYAIENERFDSSADPLQGFEVGVEARLSLWEGGRIRGEIIQAQSKLEQTLLRENAARLAAELEVRNAWNRSREAKEILDAANLGIKQAEEALRLAENRYSVGALTQLDVLSSQLEYTQAKLNGISAVHDYNVAFIDLDQAMGRIPGQSMLEVPPVR